METVSEAALGRLTKNDIANVVEVSLSLVDYYLDYEKYGLVFRPTLRFLRPGLQLPATVLRILELCMPLANLEAAGLLNTIHPPIPTVAGALGELREVLEVNPEELRTDPDFGRSLHNRVWSVFRTFTWDQVQDAPVAVDVTVDDVFLEALADLLLSLPSTRKSETANSKSSPRQFKGIVLSQPVKPHKGRQPQEICIAFGPPNERQFVFYKPKDFRTLREDYDFLAKSLQENGIEFNIGFTEFCDAVRSRRRPRNPRNTQIHN